MNTLALDLGTPSEWRCVIPGKPTTKGNHGTIRRGKGGKPFFAQNDKAVSAQQSARAIAYAERPPEPLEGPLLLDVVFVFAIPQGAREKVSKRGRVRPASITAGEPCMRRVDRGNLLKLIEDALEGVVYANDSQIVGGNVAKCWGLVDETRVVVKRADVGGGR